MCEISYVSLYAVTKVLSQIWGPLSARPPGRGALPPALFISIRKV